MHVLKALWTEEEIEPEVRSSYQYVCELRKRLETSMALAQDNLKVAQHRAKKYYDRRAKMRKLKVRDRVLVLRPKSNNKLLMQWKGPNKVDSVVRLNDYKIIVQRKAEDIPCEYVEEVRRKR